MAAQFTFTNGFSPRLEWRVDHARDYFLAGSAFAANQHRSRGVGNLLDGVLHLFHLWTGTEKAGEIAVAADLIAQLRHFGGGALLVENFVNAKVKILQLKRLAQVIVGAQLGGAEDDFGTVLGRQQDDRDFGLDLLEPLQGIESIRSRGGEVQKNQGRIIDPEHAASFLSAGGTAHVKSPAHQVGRGGAAHVGIIVHDQYPELWTWNHSTPVSANEGSTSRPTQGS